MTLEKCWSCENDREILETNGHCLYPWRFVRNKNNFSLICWHFRRKLFLKIQLFSSWMLYMIHKHVEFPNIEGSSFYSWIGDFFSSKNKAKKHKNISLTLKRMKIIKYVYKNRSNKNNVCMNIETKCMVYTNWNTRKINWNFRKWNKIVSFVCLICRVKDVTLRFFCKI